LDGTFLANNIWILICGLLVFTMTISVGLLEVGELGEEFSNSLLKTMLITGSALVLMAFVGFNTASAPTIKGVIGNPLYSGLFLGGFSRNLDGGVSPNLSGLLGGVWWSMTPTYFGTSLTAGTYFLFQAAAASVTLALVGVVALRKLKTEAFMVYSIVYFVLIWNLPAAWIWNPTGWLFQLGMRDFGGGLVVHAAAGAAGLGILSVIWLEEKKSGLRQSPRVQCKLSQGWLTLAILLLWMGWFGFSSGSVLAFNYSAMVAVVTTFLAAAASFLSSMAFVVYVAKQKATLLDAVNGVLMGLIVITPLAGFVSPGSAFILGLLAGPLFVIASRWFDRFKWFSDPVGLLPAHMIGGMFGIVMIAFFTERVFASASGNPTLPDGILFGGGLVAFQQLGIEILGIVTVMATVFALSFVSAMIISKSMNGITNGYKHPVTPVQ
jgi:Amt family ammonium transporter